MPSKLNIVKVTMHFSSLSTQLKSLPKWDSSNSLKSIAWSKLSKRAIKTTIRRNTKEYSLNQASAIIEAKAISHQTKVSNNKYAKSENQSKPLETLDIFKST